LKTILKIILLLSILVPYSVSGGSSIFGFGPQLIGTYQYPYSISALGRGGNEMSFIDSLNINQMNYALWTKLERTTVALSFGCWGISTKSDYANITSLNANFRGGFVALPLRKKQLVIGVGLMPRYTNDIGIKLLKVGPDKNITQRIEAKGNISEALILFSISLSNKLSIAFDGGYDFGLINDKTSILYNNIAYSDIIVYDEFQLQGANFGLSAFYELSDRFNLGIKYKSITNCSVHTDRKSRSLPTAIKETKSAVLPSLAAIGLNYKFSQRWQVGFDCIYQDWENSYRIDDQKVESVRNSYRFGVGLEKSTGDRRFVPYYEDISWRGGFFYSQMNVTVNDHPVLEYGLAAGISLPIRKNRNRVDISFEYGRRGNADSTTLRENFFSINLALLSSELWFVREKR